MPEVNTAEYFKNLLAKEEKIHALITTRTRYQDLLMLWDWFNHGTVLEAALEEAKTAYVRALADAEDYRSYL